MLNCKDIPLYILPIHFHLLNLSIFILKSNKKIIQILVNILFDCLPN